MDTPTYDTKIYQLFGPSDEVLISLSKYEEDKAAQAFLREKRYNMKELKDEVSYRVINYWCEQGLVTREKDNNWLKLNVVDLVWIKIITQLRNFGLSMEAIKTIKQYVFYFTPEITKEKYFLDLFIIYALERKPVGLIVLPNFQAILCHEYKINTAKRLYNTIPSHMYISLNEIVQSVFTKNNLKPIYDIKGVNLSHDEMLLLLYLRSGRYEEVKVRLKDGSVTLFEGKEQIENSTRIIDIIKKADYQDIQLKLADGKVVNITRTEKRSLKVRNNSDLVY